MGWKQPTFFVQRELMLSPEVMTKLETLAKEVAQREGCELYDLEFGGHGGRRTLRVFIDKAEGGIGIEDCSNVSRGLSLLLDVEDPITGAYDLEVSSPGLDRFLRKPWHYSRAVGKKIQIRLSKPLGEFGIENKKFSATKQLSETLANADEDGIGFVLDGEQVKIPYSAVEKAKVVFDYASKGEKKGKKK